MPSMLYCNVVFVLTMAKSALSSPLRMHVCLFFRGMRSPPSDTLSMVDFQEWTLEPAAGKT